MKPQLTVFQWSLLSGKLLCNFWAFLFSNKGRCRLDYTEEMHVKNQSLRDIHLCRSCVKFQIQNSNIFEYGVLFYSPWNKNEVDFLKLILLSALRVGYNNL